MEKFKIYDGRATFWQWDLEQKIVVPEGMADEVHFSNEKHTQAPVCDVYELNGVRLVNVPNIMLQEALPLTVYAYAKDDKGERTTYADIFRVVARPKPDDYVYTETEIRTWADLDERIKALENSSGVDPETIKGAVEDYLKENPIQETDPTVPEWAKQPQKPTYTAKEVGAQPAGDYALRDEIPEIPEIPSALPNPHPLRFTGAVNAEYDGSTPVEVNIPAGGGGIPVPETAEVGQTIVVKAVDENGKPTEWEAADLPSGGGGAEWKLIGSVTTEEEVSSVSIKSDTVLNELLVYYSIPPIPEDTGGNTYAYPMIINENGVQENINANVAITKPNTKTHRCSWHLTPTYATRQYQDNSGAAPSTLVGTIEVLTRTIAKAYKGGGGLIGFRLDWNLSNKFPAGVILEVWGR